MTYYVTTLNDAPCFWRHLEWMDECSAPWCCRFQTFSVDGPGSQHVRGCNVRQLAVVICFIVFLEFLGVPATFSSHTLLVCRMPQRIWRESKQQPSKANPGHQLRYLYLGLPVGRVSDLTSTWAMLFVGAGLNYSEKAWHLFALEVQH